MNELLSYLITKFSFLYDNYGARFVDSQVNGPHAALILEMADLRLRFVRDRGQLFLDFQSSCRPSEDDWFSFDVVRQLITNEVIDSAELDDSKVTFVKAHLDEIAKAFSKESRQSTEHKLHQYERERAERLFG